MLTESCIASNTIFELPTRCQRMKPLTKGMMLSITSFSKIVEGKIFTSRDLDSFSKRSRFGLIDVLFSVVEPYHGAFPTPLRSKNGGFFRMAMEPHAVK
ncbi:hypothetical protein VNO77_20099 [Canavalia gladiata]|uniref:Uncharacterized protein n=1 Tax=Canavalia gladiata TaxID=3824 RepID=A0AAN9LNY3_CANGL